MGRVRVFEAEFVEDCGWTGLARLELPSGALATQAAITSIAYAVYNGAALTVSGAIVVATSVFDALQGASGSDARWTIDTTGFNFRFEFPATCFPTPGTDYQVEVVITPVSGQPFAVLWRGLCEPLRAT